MRRSATSSTGLPLPPSQCRQRDEGGQKARGNARSPIFASLPLARFRETAPKRTPIPTRQPRAHDPQEDGGEASTPLGSRRTSPRAAVAARLARASRGAIGYRFSCLSLGAPGRARPTPPGRSPGLDFATCPTLVGGARGQPSPAGRKGGGAKTTLQGQPRGRGVREPGSRQQVSRGRPPANPCHTSYAFKFRPGPLSLQSPLHS